MFRVAQPHTNCQLEFEICCMKIYKIFRYKDLQNLINIKFNLRKHVPTGLLVSLNTLEADNSKYTII